MFGKKKQLPSGEKSGFFKRLRSRLNSGDSWLTYDLANLAPGGKIDESVLDDLEAELVMADVGVDTTERIISALQKATGPQGTQGCECAAGRTAANSGRNTAAGCDATGNTAAIEAFVILMVGVNGAGKTTT